MGHKITLNSKSKYLAQLLRHKPELLELKMDSQGWVLVSELIDKRAFSFQELKEIVDNDPKGRYEMTPGFSKIRAVSGHSISWVNPDLREATDIPEVLYHGTSESSYRLIKDSGHIDKMGRNYIHLTDDKKDAYTVGSRHGTPCILVLDSVSMKNDGFRLFRPQNDRYYFCESDIPVKYIKEVLWSYM